MTTQIREVVPVLRMFDVGRTKTFYCDYLGFTVDWEVGDAASGPVYMQVSQGPLVLHLSSHHGDGTPGGVVLVEVTGIQALHAELRATRYPFMDPGLEPGANERTLSMELIDPSFNRIRFFERNVTSR